MLFFARSADLYIVGIIIGLQYSNAVPCIIFVNLSRNQMNTCTCLVVVTTETPGVTVLASASMRALR